MDSTAYIIRIIVNVTPGPNAGLRQVQALDPATGNLVTHGAGEVGEDLRPYLGHRAEGYSLTLPAFRPDVAVLDGWRANGNPHRRRGHWREVGAPDVSARSFRQVVA